MKSDLYRKKPIVMTTQHDEPIVKVEQVDRDAAKALTEYAGFTWSADHLDMALEAAAEAFARHRIEALADVTQPD